MINNNKILTVSYGTFSCTLEGFDDSFGTMKVIAEYFRDLAADDRYFGAEPPQPDADMLARIAQKEVSRRVEAREQDGKIVLSAMESQTAPAIAAPLATAAVSAASQALAGAAEPAAEEVTLDSVAEDAIIDASVEEDIVVETSDVDAVSTTTVADDVEAQTPETVIADVVEEDTVEDSADAPSVADADTAEFVEDENDIVPGQRDADVGAFFAGSEDTAPAPELEEDFVEDVAEPVADVEVDVKVEAAPVEAPAAAAPAPNSIAAKLQRIRAVVAQQEEADDEDSYLEDEHAEADDEDDAADLIADARADIEDALEEDVAADTLAAAEEEEFEQEDDDDDINAILSRLEKEEADQDALDAVEEQEEAEQDAVRETDVEDTVDNLFEAPEETLEEASDDDVLANIAKATSPLRKPAAEPAEAAQAPSAPAPSTPAASAPVAPKPAAPRARVIKVKRADLEAAIEKGDLEEYEDDTPEEKVAQAPVKRRGLDDLAPAKSAKTTLSAEEQDDLARELAELENDIASDEVEDLVAAQIEDVMEENEIEPIDAAIKDVMPRPTPAARRVLPSLDETNDSSVNRLLAETDHQMDEPESATRRDAFAHLRAAVAAKKADDAMGDTAADDDTDDAYREDLAEVVRPRRPVNAAPRTERPAEPAPAPLKLVAEQRIDTDAPRSEGPVRPRRVAALADTAPADTDEESFADFASEMGASTLPQLLEAAAAYMSFVEGREQFSRPQLMTKVRQAGGQDDFSREDGLRSFGQLLRAGKIERLKGGRFTVSEDIGYRPDQRAVG